MSVVAIIAGAGSGTRFGSPLPKALISLNGVPLVVHAVRAMAECHRVDNAIVTAPAAALDDFRRVLNDAGFNEQSAFPTRVVPGGATRQASVYAGLQAARTPCFVLVHDAARALTPPDMIARVIDALEAGHHAVVPALPVVDTINEVGDTSVDGTEKVTGTLQRSHLRAVQTPQGFDYALLCEAHAYYAERSHSEDTAASDDASLMQYRGHPVVCVPGSQQALKITHPVDLAVCELLTQHQF